MKTFCICKALAGLGRRGRVQAIIGAFVGTSCNTERGEMTRSFSRLGRIHTAIKVSSGSEIGSEEWRILIPIWAQVLLCAGGTVHGRFYNCSTRDIYTKLDNNDRQDIQEENEDEDENEDENDEDEDVSTAKVELISALGLASIPCELSIRTLSDHLRFSTSTTRLCFSMNCDLEIAMSPSILLPGDTIPNPIQSPSIKLGANLHILPPHSTSQTTPTTPITSTQTGLLVPDPKRNTLSLLPFPRRRYIPQPNDLIIAQIHRSSPDYFHCIISPHTPHVLLPHLAFEGAMRKTRPQLKSGELVYARVLSVGVGPGAEIELTCVNPATGKAEPGGLGPLSGGMVFDVSVGLGARLMSAGGSGGVVVLEELGKKLESLGGFEIAVGKNGRVWVDSSVGGVEGIKMIVAIGRCLRELDEKNLGAGEQKKVVSRILREMGLGS
ncbi:exosome non-catalytic core subunit rrp40 [Emydomyces testavorans]|uniref:Exosome non-catalytic core subunit rrp40 n=1 Tax=Emydomyces testavorans TaxID=2070801 RepID=A0AAF0DPH2_9EURO|nr:exosome non-catalytic core subunit rrp40 [Emydomyces testavorans]